jgi:hypothetical protein
MSEQKRTYAEAVELMVKWWSEKSFKTALNQNNGDPSIAGGMAFIMGNMVADKAKEGATPEKIKAFEDKLTELLMPGETGGRWDREIDVDYHAWGILEEAFTHAGISSNCAPIKTFTYINAQNEIEGRYQYGGAWFII